MAVTKLRDDFKRLQTQRVTKHGYIAEHGYKAQSFLGSPVPLFTGRLSWTLQSEGRIFGEGRIFRRGGRFRRGWIYGRGRIYSVGRIFSGGGMYSGGGIHGSVRLQSGELVQFACTAINRIFIRATLRLQRCTGCLSD
jgi:hypothetical protein